MVKYENQQYLLFSLGSSYDFINRENFIDFLLIEKAGNYLPEFQLRFLTDDTNLLRWISEETTIHITVGQSETKSISTQLLVLEKEYSKTGESIEVQLSGVLKRPDYLYKPKIRYFEDKPSSSVIEEVAKENFAWVQVSPVSRDKMTWIQYNIPNRKFISELWLNSYISDEDFFIIGITSFGKFRCLSLSSIVRQEPWKGFPNERILSSKEFSYEGDIKIISRTGFINKLSTKKVAGYNEIENEYCCKSIAPQPKLSFSLIPDNISDLRLRSFQKVDFSNVHKHWIYAKAKNLSNLYYFSRLEIELRYTGFFLNHQVLDHVKLVDVDPKQKAFYDLYSGSFVITKVSRYFTAKSIVTSLTLNRESLNLKYLGQRG